MKIIFDIIIANHVNPSVFSLLLVKMEMSEKIEKIKVD